jgi:hypothetical protein
VTNDTTISIEVDGVEYALDVKNLSGREAGVLKRIAHLKGINDIPDALSSGDLETVAALAGIAMARSGITPDYEKLLDLPVGMITVKLPGSDEDPLDQDAQV